MSEAAALPSGVEHADYFTLWTGMVLVIVALLVLPWGPVPIVGIPLLFAAFGVVAPTATYVASRRERVRWVSLGSALGWLGIVLVWPFGVWNYATPALAVLLGYLVRVIGQERIVRVLGGSEAADKLRQAQELADARASLPKYLHAVGLPGAAPDDPEGARGTLTRLIEQTNADENHGRSRRVFQVPAGVVVDPELVRRRHASFAQVGLKKVHAYLDEDDHSRLVVETIERSCFAEGPRPCPPPRTGALHMGYTDSGRTISLEVRAEDAGHGMSAGQTGSGKSKTLLQWLCQWLLQQVAHPEPMGVLVWAGDPSGGKSLRRHRRFFHRFVTTPEGCVQMLLDAALEVEMRYAQMEQDPTEPESWTGPWLAVGIDEVPQVLRVGGDEALQAMQSIVERGRGAKVALFMAMLSPRAELLGKEGAKGQFPTIFAHRLGNTEEVKLALPGAGMDLKGSGPLKLTDKGRAFCKLDGVPGFPEVQIFLAPEPDDLLAMGVPVQSAHPADRPGPTDRALPTGVGDVETPAHARAHESGRSVGRSARSAATETDAKVVGALIDAGPMSARAVAAAAGVALSTAQASLKRLAAKGSVVQRAADGLWRLVDLDELEDADDE